MRKYTTIRKIYAWVGFVVIWSIVIGTLTFSVLPYSKQEKIISKLALIYG